MTTHGYSDRVHHALAFAAKHHDQQVRRGTRAPYSTQAANVGIILTRYACDDDTVIAGILHEVVKDYIRDGFTADVLAARVGDKFGHAVLDAIVSVVERRTGDEGVDFSAQERREDVLARLPKAGAPAHWAAAANALHESATLLIELRRTVDPDAVWSRYAAGRGGTITWYRDFVARLRDAGFSAPIMDELGSIVADLEQWRA